MPKGDKKVKEEKVGENGDGREMGDEREKVDIHDLLEVMFKPTLKQLQGLTNMPLNQVNSFAWMATFDIATKQQADYVEYLDRLEEFQSYPRRLEEYQEKTEKYPQEVENYPQEVKEYEKKLAEYRKLEAEYIREAEEYPLKIKEYPKEVKEYQKLAKAYQKAVKKYHQEVEKEGEAVTEDSVVKAVGIAPQEPIKPVEPVNPVRPTEPLKPIELVEPRKPVEPIKPMEPMSLSAIWREAYCWLRRSLEGTGIMAVGSLAMKQLEMMEPEEEPIEKRNW